jgi:hypothetical protein
MYKQHNLYKYSVSVDEGKHSDNKKVILMMLESSESDTGRVLLMKLRVHPPQGNIGIKQKTIQKCQKLAIISNHCQLLCVCVCLCQWFFYFF